MQTATTSVERISGNWFITGVRSAFKGHLAGNLFNTKTKTEYVWNIIDGKRVRYLKIPKEAKNVPRYVDDLIFDIEKDFTK